MNYVNKYAVHHNMNNNHNNDEKFSKEHPKKPETLVIDFGTRAIYNQNSSKIIAIPKTALANFGSKQVKKVNVKLIQSNGIKVIQLSPVIEKEVKN